MANFCKQTQKISNETIFEEFYKIFLIFQIRDVIFKHLRISRDVSILRTKRSSNGPEVRGCKPVTVYFEKWQDKDEILRKSSMLRGANIYISEDFSKRVRDQVIF